LIEQVVGSFPEQYRNLLSNISRTEVFSRNQVILGQGQYCKYLWFINSGAVKAFESIEGIDRVTYFFTGSRFFTNYYCWVTGNKSDITFQAVQDSEIVLIDYEKLEELCKDHHIFDTIGRKMAERIFVEEFHLRKLLLNYSASERYDFLEKEKPEVFQIFALKDIASFIGVTDVSLSRIRKGRSKK
jgi:CRP-like cAMP-binding protein